MQGQLATNMQDHMQCLTFRLEEEVFGTNVMRVQQVLREIEVLPVVDAPHYVTGIIRLRGQSVSVIDARTRFGLPSRQSTPMTRIMVIEARRQIIGILVDSVANIVDIEISEVETAPDSGSEDTACYIDGVVNRDDKLLILVDLNKLLTEAELGEISGLQ